MNDSSPVAPSPTISAGGFRDGLRLAGRAAHGLTRRVDLALALFIFATAGFFSTAFYDQHFGLNFKPHTPAQLEYRQRERESEATFLQRWKKPYARVPISAVLWNPAAEYLTPLRPATAIAVWVRIPRDWLSRRGFGGRPLSGILLVVSSFLLTIPIVLAYPLVYVGLLGWVRDSDSSLRITAWLRYWRDHYIPVLLIALLSQAIALVIMPLLVRLFNAAENLESGWSMALQDAVAGLMLVVGVFFLAPFAVVGRHVGTRPGIIGGWQLLRRNWPALLALFVVFRVGDEFAVALGAAASGPLSGYPVDLGVGSASLVWLWASHTVRAFLGLWVALAFMELAQRPQHCAAQSA